MRTLGIPVSDQSPRTTAVVGAAISIGEPLGGSCHPKTHHTQTLGKRSRRQLDPGRDPTTVLLCPSAARDNEPSRALTPSAGLGRARPPLGSYRDWEEGEEDVVGREEKEKKEEVEAKKKADDGDYSLSYRDSSSRYRGVHWETRANKWTAKRMVQRKNVHIGFFAIEEDAARAYQDYIKHGTLLARKVLCSAFRGVSWNRENKAWRAQLRKNGKNTFLGNFQTQQEAALAYNAAVTRLGCPASWLNDVSHAVSAGGSDQNNTEADAAAVKDTDAAAGKDAVLAAVHAKAPCRQSIGVRASRASTAPTAAAIAAVGGPSAQHLTPYELQHEAKIARNKVRTSALEVARLAQKARLPPEHPHSLPPTPPPVPAAAGTSTSKSADADAFNIEAAEGKDGEARNMMSAMDSGAATLEEAAMEARIEALEAKAALAEARAVLAEKRYFLCAR